MNGGWEALTAGELRTLAAELRAGHLAARPSGIALQRYCAPDRAEWLASALGALSADSPTIATFLELLATERESARTGPTVELVWTGPNAAGSANRDTGAVVRELFASAGTSVLIAGYAIHRGREVFRVLADRMDEDAGLSVRMVVDVRRSPGDTSLDAEVVHRFAQDFQKRQWPGHRMPEVIYDPRSLALEPEKRSAMHAKCVVIDRQVAMVTSANFTTAAQTKNIEVGALVRDPGFAEGLCGRFERLLREGALRGLGMPG